MNELITEMIKEIIIAKQLDSNKKAEWIPEKDSLSDSDKEQIKEAVLYRARNNPSTEILAFAKELRDAFILINA